MVTAKELMLYRKIGNLMIIGLVNNDKIFGLVA
ncbi:hypothetical protein SAMN05428947_10642 [Mucilaginibacter sp. OK283]|nr:hypothetical protein SAMN05428947_10642 [Mucilaginibacter sp. OK283]